MFPFDPLETSKTKVFLMFSRGSEENIRKNRVNQILKFKKYL